MQGNQRTSEPIPHITHLLIIQLVLQLNSETIRLPLKVSAQGVHTNADDGFERSEDHLEDKEGDNGRRLGCYFLGKVE